MVPWWKSCLGMYLDSLRALEKRVERTSQWTHQPLPSVDTKGLNLEVSHKDPEEYTRCMYALYSSAESIEKIRSGNPEFDSNVVPFFQSFCVQCHGPDQKKGEVILENISGEMLTGKDREKWELILDALRHNEMPPDEANADGEVGS